MLIAESQAKEMLEQWRKVVPVRNFTALTKFIAQSDCIKVVVLLRLQPPHENVDKVLPATLASGMKVFEHLSALVFECIKFALQCGCDRCSKLNELC
jgi:hypothetical protein